MARIVSIGFDDDEELAEVVVRLTAAEAAYLAKLTGKQNHTAANEMSAGGAEATGGTYDALTRVFNGLYDDGVNDWPGKEKR